MSIKIGNEDIPIKSKTNYSTSEQVVGTWINGKPLYEKTISKSLGTWTGSYVGQAVSLSTDVIDSNIEACFITQAVALYGIVCRPLQHYYSTPDDVDPTTLVGRGTDCYVSRRVYITRYDADNIDGYTAYITVRYTKTTDTV